MDLERIEELLRTRWPRERTYDRRLPALIETSRPLKASVRIGRGSPAGLGAAAVALVLIVVAGAMLSGGWRNGRPVGSGQQSASPALSTPAAIAVVTVIQPRVVLSFGSDDLGSVVLGPDGAAYVLDNTVNTVYRVDLLTGAKLPILTVNLEPVPGGDIVGNPRLLATGGGDVLILDSFDNLWRWHPAQGDTVGRGVLAEVNIPDSRTWGTGVRAIGTFIVNPQLGQYNFYVVVPSQQQVVKYFPAPDGSGYPAEGRANYLSVAQDVTKVDDMYVDGKVYIVEGGTITQYQLGQAVHGWSPQAAPGTWSLPQAPFYTRLASDDAAQDQGNFYAFDKENTRIVAFKKGDGIFVAWYRAPDNTTWLSGLTGMFVVPAAAGANPTLYWTESGNLMRASLDPIPAP
jgi:hypothetical protein